jgi:hypothetical protein
MNSKLGTNIFLGSFLMILCFLVGCKGGSAPARLPNIPKNATWIGGSDGGSWLEIINTINDTAFNIRIYNDENGRLDIDTIFSLTPDCSVKKVDSTSLLNAIDGFDGEEIILSIKGNGGKKCALVPQ